MRSRILTLFIVILITILISCNNKNCIEKNKAILKSENPKEVISSKKNEYIIHRTDSGNNDKNCKCSAQIDLADGSKLRHIKGVFYKSETGHLYEKTIGMKEVDGHLTDNEYFNGYFSQDVDPFTFEPLDGWYAKDKKFIYYYKPESGGQQISKIERADIKTFEILKGHYKYAKDKKYFYEDGNIIEDFIPDKTKLLTDNKNRIYKMTCKNKTFNFEIVN